MCYGQKKKDKLVRIELVRFGSPDNTKFEPFGSGIGVVG